MTDNVIKFGKVRVKGDLMANGQHLSGAAHCLGCKHEWVAVTEVTSEGFEGSLECPACGGHRGQYVWPFAGPPSEKVWTCRCGGQVFMLTEQGTRCIGCGRHQVFDG